MKKIIFIGILCLVAVMSCRHHIDDEITPPDNNGNGNGNNNPDTTAQYVNPHPCSPDSVYFTNDILPLIVSHCAMDGCHSATASGDDTDPYTNYSQIRQHRNSMLSEMLGCDMPPQNSGISLTSEQITMFQTWIQQGALNNSCIPDCDTTSTVTFSTTLMPIINSNCSGCHNSSNPSGGVPLTNYTEVIESVNDGSFMNSLYGTNGVSIMPDNTGGLPDCIIQQFQHWVDDGAPNN